MHDDVKKFQAPKSVGDGLFPLITLWATWKDPALDWQPGIKLILFSQVYHKSNSSTDTLL